MTGVVTPRPDTARRATGPRRTLAVLGGVAVLVAGVLVGFVVTTLGAARTGELALDVSISEHRDLLLTAIARVVDVGLGTRVAPVLLLVGCALLWRRSRFVAVSVAALTVAGWLSVEIGKLLVQRPRPPAATVHALVTETAADSYPSGHTAFAAATVFAAVATLALAGRSTRAAWIVGLPVVVVVALSRLYLGVHYLTDVVASVAFAGASIVVVSAVVRPVLARLRDSEAEGEAA